MGNAAVKTLPEEEAAESVEQVAKAEREAIGPAYDGYDQTELVEMVQAMLGKNGPGIDEIQRAFGEHMLRYCAHCYPDYFESEGLFAFLTDVQSRIHADVRKAYPDVDLPSFECREENEARLVVTVYAPPGATAFAEGLVSGCARFYDEQIALSKTDLSGDGTEFQIVIERVE